MAVTPEKIEPGVPSRGRLSSTASLACHEIDVPKGEPLHTSLRSDAFAPVLQVARGALCQGAVVQREASAAKGESADMAFESVGGRYLVIVRPLGEGEGEYTLSVDVGQQQEEVAGPALDAGELGVDPELLAMLEEPADAAPEEVDPRMALMRKQVSSHREKLAAEEARRREEERQRQEAEWARQERERIARQEREQNRQAMFNAVLGGLSQVADAVSESNAYRAEQQARQADLMNRVRQDQQRQANQRAAQAAQARQQEQAQARQAVAEQLARANAYRNQQLATTTDPAYRQQLLAQNESALQAARQLGVEQQVAQNTAAQSAADNARREQQAREQQAREQQARAEAEQQRQRADAERREREQENARLAREQAEAERLRAEEQRRLAAQQALRQAAQNLRSSFQGSAVTCPGGGQNVFYLRSSTPPKTGCNVSFEARCPGTPSGAGIRFSQANYIGASCLGVGDIIRIGSMGCPAEQVRIDMTDADCG